MNAERLHALAAAVHGDYVEHNVVATLDQLVSSLEQQVNQPNQPSHQESVTRYLDTLKNILDQSETNSFSPLWIQDAEELGLASLMGSTLKERIMEVFLSNVVTPASALAELKSIQSELREKFDALDKAISAFQKLGIGSEALDPGECELAVLVPRSAVDNSLENFGREAIELNRVFGVFNEIAVGTREKIDIRNISSSDLSLFLEYVPEAAACAAFAIERVVSLYKQLLEIRELRERLLEQEVPDNALEGISEHADSVMERGIDIVVDEVFDQFYSSGDLARGNELRVELKFSLNKIARRIDAGYNIDVRVGSIVREEDAEDADGEPDAQQLRTINAILEASLGLKFIKSEGAPILSLPESEPDNNEGGDSGG